MSSDRAVSARLPPPTSGSSFQGCRPIARRRGTAVIAVGLRFPTEANRRQLSHFPSRSDCVHMSMKSAGAPGTAAADRPKRHVVLVQE